MNNLLEVVRSYLPADKARLVEDALEFAVQKHAGQTRRSGHPYIEHPVSIARYLADLHLDTTTLSAALLHDVIEDCGVTVEELRGRFGDDVARLVDGVTKLTHLDLMAGDDGDQGPGRPDQAAQRTNGTRAESLRKMLVAMAEDIRVVLIKLADRLHNMQTLGAMPPDRRVAIAQETLDIYAPLAHRLGMGEIKWQLEDLSFRRLQPNQYRSVSRLLSTKRQEREAYVRQVTQVLNRELARAGLQGEVTGRPKHIYSIYHKAQSYAEQGKEFGDIFDLFAVRVLVPTLPDCYGALGVVHGLWRPLPGQFDDYIANPKENMYQSLHTTVRCIGGVPIEVQVRTHQMHQVAEYGVASHWNYKEGQAAKDMRFDDKMNWMRQLLDWQRELSGAEDFLESVKTDIFNDQVYVYTPKGEIKELSSGSTPIDFAYHIHTELGHRCIGSKVNGKLVRLDYQLRNGDTVEILTSKVARGPSLDWLNSHLGYTKTATARQRIRAWFRRQERVANIQRGRDLFKKEVRRLNAPVSEMELLRSFKQESMEDLHASLGSGLIGITQVAARLSAHQERSPAQDVLQEEQLTAPTSGIRVVGVGDLLTRLALCCQPVPGDRIVGYVTRMRGVTVHRQDCSTLRREEEQERLISVSWGQTHHLYPVQLGIEAWDRVGLLRDITAAVSAEGVSISSTQTEVHDDGTVSSYLTAMVASMAQLSRLFTRLEGVRSITSVVRTPHSRRPSVRKAESGAKRS
jgi:guanosine-3',5'-bis(diphosphate) 3'-pyrophosphohydrolase